MNLLPEPRNIELKEDGKFRIDGDSKIILSKNCNLEDLDAAQLLQEEINNLSGLSLAINKVHNLKDSCFKSDKVIYLDKREDTKLNSAQNYQLDINASAVSISASNSSGLFYGIQTLRQILRSEGVALPCLSITDSPYFKERGFYHDVTRGKVPTLTTLKKLVDKISFYKINQLQLYVEHSFAFENMSEIWTGADPLTAEEILELDSYCQKRQVELVPSLSTFGHLYQALITSSYSYLSELDAGPDKTYSWVDRQHHHTLDVSNPDSFEFVKSMLDQYIPLFSSRKFNICCDETFDLGEGKNKELADKVGKGRLYIDFLKKIINYVKSYDREVMFWGDIIIQHPELLDEIPDDVTCLNWEYSAVPDEEKVATVSRSGIKQYLCPGVSGWNKLMNDMDTAFSNIENMVAYGEEYNAIGILNTDWGDYGHVNLLANSIPGMIYGAALSWNPDTINKINGDDRYFNIDRIISQLEFEDSSGEIVGLLRELARQQPVDWGMIIRWKENKYQETDSIFNNRAVFQDISEEDLWSAYNNTLSLSDDILQLSMDVKEKYNLDYREFYISTVGIALFNALALIIKRYDFDEEVKRLIIPPTELAAKLEYWLDDYKEVWRARNKESELYRIENVIQQLCKYLRGL